MVEGRAPPPEAVTAVRAFAALMDVRGRPDYPLKAVPARLGADLDDPRVLELSNRRIKSARDRPGTPAAISLKVRLWADEPVEQVEISIRPHH